jgi:NitT/TauT family transport system ATP-binding protein
MIVKILLIYLSGVIMLKFNKVSFSYDNKTTILDNIDLNFKEKKINCLLGPNGSGKTTILKLISRILKPTNGSIINTNKRISYVFQEDRLIEQLTIYQNLDLVIRDIYKDKNTRSAKINKYLKMVGMQHVKERYPHQLSESMRQCVSLARAFIYPSKLLLLDEPFINLDVNAQKKLLNLTIKL